MVAVSSKCSMILSYDTFPLAGERTFRRNQPSSFQRHLTKIHSTPRISYHWNHVCTWLNQWIFMSQISVPEIIRGTSDNLFLNKLLSENGFLKKVPKMSPENALKKRKPPPLQAVGVLTGKNECSENVFSILAWLCACHQVVRLEHSHVIAK